MTEGAGCDPYKAVWLWLITSTTKDVVPAVTPFLTVETPWNRK
jgi:hypothetical protein